MRRLLLALLLAACAPKGTGSAEPLAVGASAPAYALVGEAVRLDGSATKGARTYQWAFGDGNGWDAPRDTAIAEATYAKPGRYQAVLTAWDAEANRKTASVTVVVTNPLTFTSRQSATITRLPDGQRFAVVNEDADEVVLLQQTGTSFAVTRRVPTAHHPRTVAALSDRLIVACEDDAIEVVPFDGGTSQRLPLRYGARPWGAVAVTGDMAFVSLQGTGEVARVERQGTGFVVAAVLPAVEDARGLALLPDGRLAVSRWRSLDREAQIAVLGPGENERTIWKLAYDEQLASDTEVGGIPSYLTPLLVTPDGLSAVVPSLQVNHAEAAPVHDTFLRAAASWIALPSGEESLARRQQFDNRGLASAGLFSSHGDYLFLAMRGNRSVERIDVLRDVQAGSIQNTGYAPEGLALSADDRFLLVHAALSREVAVFDVTDFRAPPVPLVRLALSTAEPLDPPILRGKQLFNDSADPRLGKDGYMACAHCHLEGDSDRRVWNFTARGEGLRNTIALLGRGGSGHGPIHWSANFDEIQDFENDIRNGFSGTGLLSDADFAETSATLGASKAGRSADLDALAAYVGSLTTFHRSPYRAEDGSLTPAALRGKALFESTALGCVECHSGDRFTDSTFTSPGVPLLHDVGTLRETSGHRLGGALTGLDTPTLHGLWESAPYLHDGSAATLRAVLTTRNPNDQHGKTSHLTPGELDDLEAWLLSLDGAR